MKATILVQTIICTFLWLIVPLGAAATSIHGRSSTVLEWQQTPDEETTTPIYEFLNISIRDIADAGYNARIYGRLAGDLSGEDSPDSKLYYAYVEKKGIDDFLDLRVGRQFVNTNAGSSLVDGLLASLHHNRYQLTLFGGGDVSFYDDYDSGDAIAGIELNGKFSKMTGEISFVRKWDEEDVAYDLAGASADLSLPHFVTLYGETQYSLLTEEVTYGLVGGNWQGSEKWTARLEYLYSLPVFSSTSIYSVFAVAAYEELSADLSYRFSGNIRGILRYVREIYDEYEDADLYEAGVDLIAYNNISGYLVATLRDDTDGQDLRGVKCYASYKLDDGLNVGVGVHLDTLERRIEEDDETTSRRLWLDASASLTKTISVSGKVEHITSDLWDSYSQGRIRLTKIF